MSIKKNILYSSVLTVSNFLFPLLVYPYISRVLGATNIGICNFVDSIINYFILFSMMGISTIGIREIAKTKGDDFQLSKTFSSLLMLNIISTVIVLIVLLLAVWLIPDLQKHREMMYIGALKLIFNCLLIEWFYKGLENFKFITQRTILVRLIYVVLVFVCVRDKDDYDIYYLLTVLTIVFNAFVNIFYSRKFIHVTLKGISMSPYLRSFFILGVYALLTSMYTSFNVAYLGFVAGETEVGYYTTAVKLYTVLISLFTAFTGVMMPRMSSLIAEGKYDDFKRLTDKSIDVLLTFVMPIIVFSMAFTPQIIAIISGPGYEAAITPMRIIVPLLLIIGYEQIIIIQILTPLKKDKAILINSALGGLVGILMNFLLVSDYQSIGSAIVWVTAELTVLCSGQYFVGKFVNETFPIKKIVTQILWAIPLGGFCYGIKLLHLSVILTLLLGGFLIVMYYSFIDIYIFRNDIMMSLIRKIKLNR